MKIEREAGGDRSNTKQIERKQVKEKRRDLIGRLYEFVTVKWFRFFLIF